MQLQNKWWVDRSECPVAEKDSAETDDELSLKSLAGIFYILIGGLGLAVIVALMEFCWHSRKEARKRQVRINLVLLLFPCYIDKRRKLLLKYKRIFKRIFKHLKEVVKNSILKLYSLRSR